MYTNVNENVSTVPTMLHPPITWSIHIHEEQTMEGDEEGLVHSNVELWT